ncbi:PorT family protein [Parvicella tangerina]|uniref:Outer membrane protein beta-barrel domain-containing protein n=1 Tax=Parvicella tangerina TaxID=2829795 RepID=A0A916JL87_9FLAO|nr:PorT family protein [Parvicella tangerina]CAG5077209.1 hypothetical protein CRYO30217_00319 [Parvicella tangerina]
MKKIYLILTPLFLTTLTYAQDEQPINDDTTKIKMGNMTIIINDDDTEEGDFDFDMDDTTEVEEKSIGTELDMQLGMNGWLNSSNSTVFSDDYLDMSLQLNRSRSFGMHMMMSGLDIFKGHVFLSPGIGFTWNSYHFENKYVSLTTGNDTTMFLADSAIQFDKYKLRATYAELPITLGFRIGNLDKTFLTVQAGVIGGINIGSIVKQRYFVNSTKYKEKIKDDFNVNPFKLDGIVKLKFKESIGVFARYSFTTMFEQGKTQTVYPFAIGITIGGV